MEFALDGIAIVPSSQHFLRIMPGPLFFKLNILCEAVISESCFLLKHYENGIDNVLKLIERNLLAMPFRLEDELSSIKILLGKYANIPMSLADGCLVRMAEQNADSVICTLDSDFKIYRKDRRKVIPTIIPADI